MSDFFCYIKNACNLEAECNNIKQNVIYPITPK